MLLMFLCSCNKRETKKICKEPLDYNYSFECTFFPTIFSKNLTKIVLNNNAQTIKYAPELRNMFRPDNVYFISSNINIAETTSVQISKDLSDSLFTMANNIVDNFYLNKKEMTTIINDGGDVELKVGVMDNFKSIRCTHYYDLDSVSIDLDNFCKRLMEIKPSKE